MITLHLMNGLHVEHPGQLKTIRAHAEGMSMKQALLDQCIPLDLVWMVTLGSRVVSMQHVLHDADEVWVYPPVDGG